MQMVASTAIAGMVVHTTARHDQPPTRPLPTPMARQLPCTRHLNLPDDPQRTR